MSNEAFYGLILLAAAVVSVAAGIAVVNRLFAIMSERPERSVGKPGGD